MRRTAQPSRHPPRWLIWLVLLLPLLGLELLGSGLVWSQWTQLKRLPISVQHGQLLDRITQRLSQKQAHLVQLTRLLQNSQSLRQALNARTGFDPEMLGQLFLRVSATSPLIDQLRWIDLSGQERLRLDSGPDGPRFQPPEALQNKAHRDYFQHALSIASDEVQLSPLDLNIEHGLISIPPKPTIRSMVHTGLSDDQLPGVLVINFSLRQFFVDLEQLQSDQLDVWLVNDDGYWLIHPDDWRRWGFIYRQPELVVAEEFPRLWQQMQHQPSRRDLLLQDRLWSYTRIDPEPDIYQQTEDHWYLVLSTPPGYLAQQRQTILLPLAGIAGGILLLGGGLLWRLAGGEHQRRQLIDQLACERDRLNQRNRELDLALQRQQLLQDELVETRKLSSLGMMVAGVAHELNTPSGAVLMTLSTLRQDLQQLQKALDQNRLTREQMVNYLQHTDEGLGLAEQNIRKTTGLIRSFKRLALERSLEAPVSFTLQDCLQDLVASLQPRLKQQSVRLELDLPDCTLFSHPGILSQVLQNLIDNALEHAFTDADTGVIRLQGKLQDEGMLEIKVCDNGHGIPETILPTLFDPFVTSGRGRGHTGLGLHLVHQWMSQILQGSIRVDSAPKQGSCFILNLPLDLRDRQTSP